MKITPAMIKAVGTVVIAIAGSIGAGKIMAAPPAAEQPRSEAWKAEAIRALREDLAGHKLKAEAELATYKLATETRIAAMERDIVNACKLLDKVDLKIDRLMERPK